MTGTTYEDACGAIKVHLGNGFDELTVYEDIDTMIEDDDDNLTVSAMSRLGIKDAHKEAIQLAAFDMEDDAATQVLADVKAAKTKAKASTKPAKAKAPEAPAAGAIPAQVVEALKHCGVGDTAMAEQLGVSRTTYTNYCKGKTEFVPDDEQSSVLRAEIIDRTNRLLTALANLDGSEEMQVA